MFPEPVLVMTPVGFSTAIPAMHTTGTGRGISPGPVSPDYEVNPTNNLIYGTIGRRSFCVPAGFLDDAGDGWPVVMTEIAGLSREPELSELHGVEA